MSNFDFSQIFKKFPDFLVKFRINFEFIQNFFENFRFCQISKNFDSNFRKILLNFPKFLVKFSKNSNFLPKISVKFSKNFELSILFKFRKISISEILKNFYFGQIFEKFWSNFEKFRFRSKKISSKFSKISYQIFEKISILFEICEKFWFFRKFRKISISVKFPNNFELGQISKKTSILFQISENFEKFRFWWNFRKNSIWTKCSKISKNFGQNFEINRFWSKITLFKSNFRKISILVKFRFWSKFSKIFDYNQTSEKNFVFLVNFFKNFDFCQSFEKISILFEKKIDFGQIFQNIDFRLWYFRKKWSIFLKIWFLSKFRKKNRFWSNFPKYRFCYFRKNVKFG